MAQKNYLLITGAVILLIALGSYWLINRQRLKPVAMEEIITPPAVSKPLTAEEIAKISESLTASGEKALSLAQKQKLEKSATAPSRESKLSQEEMEKLLQSLSAPK